MIKGSLIPIMLVLPVHEFLIRHYPRMWSILDQFLKWRDYLRYIMQMLAYTCLQTRYLLWYWMGVIDVLFMCIKFYSCHPYYFCAPLFYLFWCGIMAILTLCMNFLLNFCLVVLIEFCLVFLLIVVFSFKYSHHPTL